MDHGGSWWEKTASDLLEVKVVNYPGAWICAALTFIVLLAFLGAAELVRPCRVEICRRRDDMVLKRCRHFMRSAAHDQYDYMSERLASEDVRSFCAEFGITKQQLA